MDSVHMKYKSLFIENDLTDRGTEPHMNRERRDLQVINMNMGTMRGAMFRRNSAINGNRTRFYSS